MPEVVGTTNQSREEANGFSVYRIEFGRGIDGWRLTRQMDAPGQWSDTWLFSNFATNKLLLDENRQYTEVGRNRDTVFFGDPIQRNREDVALKFDLAGQVVLGYHPLTRLETVFGNIDGVHNPVPGQEFNLRRTDLSRVEFKYLNAVGGGYFIQIDATTWLEQHWGQTLTRVYVEYGRGDDWVAVMDFQRNLRIRLDLPSQKVLPEGNGATGDALYPIVGACPGPPKGVFQEAKEFNDWIASGGPDRLGLPAEKLTTLNTLVLDFRGRSAHIFYDVDHVRELWSVIETTRAHESVTPLVQDLTARLASMGGRCDALVKQAANCRTLVMENDGAEEVLRARIPALEAALPEPIRGMGGGREKALRENRPAAINEAVYYMREHGLPNGISADKFMGWYASQLRIADEIAEAQTTLKNVSGLNAGLTDYQNYLSKAESAVETALKDAEKSQFSESDHVGSWYSRMAGKQIKDLVDWTDRFPTH